MANYTSDEANFIKTLFTQDKDLFDPASWYSLDGRFAYVKSRTRRYQIAWQARTGTKFLQNLNDPELKTKASLTFNTLVSIAQEYHPIRG